MKLEGCNVNVLPMSLEGYATAINILGVIAHTIAKEKGWWHEKRREEGLIALMHSELSEALEALRNGNKPSKILPKYSEAELEYADTIIRILDNGQARGYRIGDAVVDKMKYNLTRENMHGKRF
jgi:hypothetical protein